eukprot:gene7703-9533_t
MSFKDISQIAGSAMAAQTVRLNTVASNLANADTVAGPDGQAYKARQVVFQTQLMGAGNDGGNAGVRVSTISEDQTQVRNVFVTQFQDGKLTVVASSGGRITAQPNGDRFLVLEDGRRWDGTWGGGAYRLMEFERYGVRLQAKSSE